MQSCALWEALVGASVLALIHPYACKCIHLLQAREDKAGGTSNLLYYAPLESILQHDGKYVSKASTAA